MFTLNHQPKYFNAIVVVKVGGKYEFKKYHTIKNDNHRLCKFIDFAKNKFPQAKYVNFYNKETRRFFVRKKI